jgi:hypothetical protein
MALGRGSRCPVNFCGSRVADRADSYGPLWQDYLRLLQANRVDNADQLASERAPPKVVLRRGFSLEAKGKKRSPAEAGPLIKRRMRSLAFSETPAGKHGFPRSDQQNHKQHETDPCGHSQEKVNSSAIVFLRPTAEDLLRASRAENGTERPGIA